MDVYHVPYRLQVTLPEKLRGRLWAVIKGRGTTLQECVVTCLEEYVSQQEGLAKQAKEYGKASRTPAQKG